VAAVRPCQAAGWSGLLGGAVEQELAVGLLALDADLDLQRPEPAQFQLGHAVDVEEPERGLELPLGVVPEDDAVALLVEEAFEGGGDLVQIAPEGLYQMRVTP
jgi:hypothetical protein